jgi:alanyl-tRNA synthetase
MINIENNDLNIDNLLLDKFDIINKYSLQDEFWCDDNATALVSHLEYDNIDMEYAKIGEKQSTSNNVLNEIVISENKEEEIAKTGDDIAETKLQIAIFNNLIKEKGFAAGKLISEVAKQLGGGGGGRPQLATAGAKDIDKLDDVLLSFKTDMIKKLSE